MDIKDCFHISVVTDKCDHILLINYHLSFFSRLRLKCCLNYPLCLLLFFRVFFLGLFFFVLGLGFLGFWGFLFWFVFFFNFIFIFGQFGFLWSTMAMKALGVCMFLSGVCLIWNQCWWIWRLSFCKKKTNKQQNKLRLFENYSIYLVFHSYCFLKFMVSLTFWSLSILKQFPEKT